MAKAFEGVRIVDFSQVLAGPFASQLLAFLGADVIKIEQPGAGDQGRGLLADNDLGEIGMSPMFLAVNGGKRSVTLDLKHPRAKEVLERLVREADVVLQNFRAGVIDRLGFGYDWAKSVKPDIVYCSVSGYGQAGPSSASPAYDGAIQAASGMMAMTGHEDKGPTRAGFTAVDIPTAIMAAFAISGGLHRKQVTGEGQFLDVAMMDTAVGICGPFISAWMNCGAIPPLIGNGSQALIPTADVFKVKDGSLMVTVLTDSQWLNLCKSIGRPDLPDDPRFANLDLRRANAVALKEELESAFAAANPQEWEKRLSEGGVPASAVNGLPEVAEHPQMAHRDVLHTYDPVSFIDRPVQGIGAGFIANVDTPAPASPPPTLGEHTDEVLEQAGYSAEDIAGLRNEGAI